MSARFRAGTRFRLVLVVLVLLTTTLLFGGVELPAQLPLILVGTALLVWSLLGREAREDSDRRSAGRGFVLLLGGIVTLVLVQLVPVPAAVRRLVAPGGEKTLEAVLGAAPEGWRGLFAKTSAPETLDTVTLWKEGATTSAAAPPAPTDGSLPAGPSRFRPLSVVPGATAASLALVLAYFGVFFATVPIARREKTLEWAVDVLLGIGLLVAVVGLAQDVSRTKAYFGLRPFSHASTPYGPFANRNHFGAFVAMLLPLAAFTAMERLDRAFRGTYRRREDVVNSYARVFVHAFTALVLATALVRCLSRGALGSAAIGLAVGALLLRRAELSKRTLAVGALFALILAAAVVFLAADGEAFRRRSQETLESADGRRGQLARAALIHFRDFPVFGSGLGTFPYTSSLHRPPTGTAEVQRAHDDYLEVLAENGIAGGILLVMALVLLAREVRHAGAVVRRRHRAIWAALTAGMVAVLVHETADFNLQIPALATLLSIQAGLVTGLARTSRGESDGAEAES